MKKLILLTLATMFLVGSAMATDRKTIKRDQMPKAALKYVQENFNNTSIRRTCQLVDGSKISYEVVLVDNTVIVFNRDGGVRSVKAETEVAEGAIPWGVRYYVKSHFRKHKVVSVVKNLDGYTIGMDNGRTIKCDLKGNVLE